VTPAAIPAPARAAAGAPGEILRRTIPSSGEVVPAIGLGSWQTFDVAREDVAAIQPVLARFLALGGRIVDSSPMYGGAEAAIGVMLANLRMEDPATPAPFLATKVWTSGERKGQDEMRRSMQRMGAGESLDLMQIHNLLDWKVHLKTLRAWKDAGTFRYIGITHYQHGAFGELEQLLRRERLDFIQLPYSVSDRLAEERLLPAAADTGTAVLVMQPFDSGGIFGRVRGKALPPVAAELGATSWAQLFLLWILGHPAVTAPIPATAKVAHIEDNLAALRCRVPDDAQRAAIVQAIG
jgi:diketogulonate reductase-like aldo/keto reductase